MGIYRIASRTEKLYRKLSAFKKKMLSGQPQLERMFTDPALAKTFIDPYTFADDLYNVAADTALPAGIEPALRRRVL